MKIYYNEHFNCFLVPPMSISPSIEVPDSFNLTKRVNVKLGTKQKTDEDGNLLFIQDVFETKTQEVVTGYTETIKSSIDGVELSPVMIQVQKTDDEGNSLYYVVNDKGETEETTKVTDYPVMIQVHKTNVAGKPLYKYPTIKNVEEQVKVGEKEVTINTGRPVMVDVVVNKEVSILSNPEYFTIQEVLTIKYNDLVKQYGENILYTEFIDLSQVNSFTGNTGLGFVQIAPKTKLVFKPIKLKDDCNTIDLIDFKGDSRVIINIGERILKGNEIKLASNEKQMDVILVNNTNEYLNVSKVCISACYKEQTEKEKLEARITTIEDNQAQMQKALDDILLGGM